MPPDRMLLTLTLVPTSGRAVEVTIRAAPGTTLREVAPALAAAAGSPDDGLWSGSTRLDPAGPLGGPGLRHGCVLGVGGPGPREAPAPSVLELRLVGGPGGGRTVPLARGEHLIGRDAGSDLVLGDPTVSRTHVRLRVGTDGVHVRDAGATNPAEIDGSTVRGRWVGLRPTALLRVGQVLIAVGPPVEVPARPTPEPDGTLRLVPAPRLRAGPPPMTVDLPIEPAVRPAARLAVLALLIPVVAGAGLALVLRTPAFLLFTLLSPLMLLGTWLSDRSGRRRGGRDDRRRYDAELATASALRERSVARDTGERRFHDPDPAAVVQTALHHGRRLWERPPQDPDWMSVRLGTARLPGGVSVRCGPTTTPVIVADLPVTVELAAVGVLGIHGPAGPSLALARWLVCQLAVRQGPRSLRLVVIVSPLESPGWSWVRWLPHARSSPPPGTDPAEAARQVLAVVEDRIARDTGRGTPSRRAPPDLVVVLSAAAVSECGPQTERILRDGPALGVLAVWVGGPGDPPPSECAAVAQLGGAYGTDLRLHVRGGAAVHDVLVDGLTGPIAESVSRSLAPLREGGVTASGALPRTLRLLDLPGVPGPTAPELGRRWATYAGVPEVTLGVSTGGPFRVDLVRDGPHVLVAGTTGAGKSELLQTLLAGLAAVAPPSAVQLVLVDYKGGAAFRDLADLPHTAGLVTDLDEHLTRRALTSLRAELTRRERLLGSAGADDLAGYLALGRTLARLFIVVDEFAALAQELPDFVDGLVAVAARGRSLGIHLILATQRPGGSVTPAIRANTALRIALRVTDEGESRDIVEQAGAARISRHTPGRALVRAGPEPATLVQTARVTGRPPPAGPRPPRVAPGWTDPDVGDVGGAEDETTPTDLRRLVDAARGAAAASRWVPLPSPWLAALPELLRVSDLAEPELGPGDQDDRTVAFGLVDRPHEQRRELLTYDLAGESSLLIAGGPGSGRSTTLRTLLHGLARRWSPEELHLHLIDTASGLGSVRGLPHCGTTLDRDDVDRGQRLLARLVGQLQDRQRAPTASDPFLVLVVDGWEALTQVYEPIDAGAPVEAVLRLIREGGPVGIRVILTSDRTGLGARLSGAVSRRLILPLADPADYALAGVPIRAVPGHRPPGRAILPGVGLEVQIAVCGLDASGPAQAAGLQEVARGRGPARCHLPLRIGALPRTAPRDRLPASTVPMRVTVGVGGDEVGPLVLDLDHLPGFLVAGPARSGRTTALLTLATGLVEGGTPVAAVCGRRSPLREVVAAHGPSDPLDDVLRAFASRPGVVVVDNLETMLDTPAEAALLAHLRGDGAGCVIGAGRTEDLIVAFRGLGAQLRRQRTGVLLCPDPLEGELLGLRLPRGVRDRTPGRGHLVVAGAATRIQVALPGPALSPGAGSPPGSAGRRSP